MDLSKAAGPGWVFRQCIVLCRTASGTERAAVFQDGPQRVVRFRAAMLSYQLVARRIRCCVSASVDIIPATQKISERRNVVAALGEGHESGMGWSEGERGVCAAILVFLGEVLPQASWWRSKQPIRASLPSAMSMPPCDVCVLQWVCGTRIVCQRKLRSPKPQDIIPSSFLEISIHDSIEISLSTHITRTIFTNDDAWPEVVAHFMRVGPLQDACLKRRASAAKT